MDSTQESPAIISICTGSRGLEKGLAAAIGREPRVAAYVEIEAFICQNLVGEMEAGVLDPTPIYTDLTTFSGQGFRGKVHGIVGGYPCQGESNAGKRLLWEDPRFLWPHIERLFRATDPLFGYFENVSGHLTGSFPYVLASLRDMGYRVEAGLFAAEEVGGIQRERIVTANIDTVADIYRRFPHQRQRIFILAVKLEHAQRDGYLAATLRPSSPAPDNQEPPRPQATGHPARAGRPNGYCGVHEELEHPAKQGLQSSGHARIGQHETETGGGVLDRPQQPSETNQLAHSNRKRQPHGQPQKHPTENGKHAQRNPAAGSNEELANGTGIRMEGMWTEGKPEPHTHDEQGISVCDGGGFAVARPGWPQHGWEEPRAVESGMGVTVNGYNFREDLLRMAGNAVVPQQSEHAFRYLYHQIFGEQ